MNFFDNLFDDFKKVDYSITGLNSELFCINVYDAFIRNNKSFLVVANTTYEANLIYQSLINYTDKVLFFPMDDFLTSEAIAISPEFKAERINTLNILSDSGNYIVVTNLMGSLRYLPLKRDWIDSKITIKIGDDYPREKLIGELSNLGYESVKIVNGTGQMGIRGYVVDVFPISFDNAIRIEFWGDTVDSIKFFNIDTQISISEIDSVTIFPYSEFLLMDNQGDAIRSQKYLKHYNGIVANISDYLDNPVVYYYDYRVILNSYGMLLETIKDYDNENHGDISTAYMNALTDINSSLNVYYYHFDEDISSDNVIRYNFSSIVKYNGNYENIRKSLIEYINNKKTVDDFSVVVSYDDIKNKNYSLSAGQYFDIKIEYVELTKKEFDNLKVGDEFKTFDKTIKIESKIPSYKGTGEILGYIVNGDIDEGGYFILLDDDGKWYRNSGYDNYYITYPIGKAKIRVSKNIVMEDRTVLQGPYEELRDSEKVYYGDIEDAIRKKVIKIALLCRGYLTQSLKGGLPVKLCKKLAVAVTDVAAYIACIVTLFTGIGHLKVILRVAVAFKLCLD